MPDYVTCSRCGGNKLGRIITVINGEMVEERCPAMCTRGKILVPVKPAPRPKKR